MTGGHLTQLAAEEQRRFDAVTSPQARKGRGHFGTAPAIAEFMAGMFTRIPEKRVRILDPGAGVGTLSAAVCQRILSERTPRHVIFELWENDQGLESPLRRTMKACQKTLRDAGHEMEFTIEGGDFVLEHAKSSLFAKASAIPFDLVIMNPPYFKLRKDSECAQAMGHVVHGQPNIYTIFMATAADLMVKGGEMVAITPRSYFNGPYFKRFRKWFFDRVVARQIHVFESRSDVFREDDVLQENVILLAEKGGMRKDVVLTSTADRSFRHLDRHTLEYTKVIEDRSGDHLVRVATDPIEQRIIEAVDSLPLRFRELPFKISTGPVVTFRSEEFLREDRAADTAPLLWMHNVRPFLTRFPPKNGKPTHIVVNNESKRLLVPAKRYVLLKRFTSKEERRRLVAGIVESTDSYSPFLGLENHLNYVYRPAAEVSSEEAIGLAALFNSKWIDLYFRAISGSTQVNAAEIRAMPVPTLVSISQLGRELTRKGDGNDVDRRVAEAIGLPEDLALELSLVSG